MQQMLFAKHYRPIIIAQRILLPAYLWLMVMVINVVSVT